MNHARSLAALCSAWERYAEWVNQHIHSVVNAIAHIPIKPPNLAKQGFVAGGAATVAMIGGVVLGIRFRFHNHAPQQLTIRLPYHQQAADQLVGDDLGGAGEKGLVEALGEVGGFGGWGKIVGTRK